MRLTPILLIKTSSKDGNFRERTMPYQPLGLRGDLPRKDPPYNFTAKNIIINLSPHESKLAKKRVLCTAPLCALYCSVLCSDGSENCLITSNSESPFPSIWYS